MFRLLLPLVLAAGVGLFGLTGCSWTIRGSIAPVSTQEFVEKGTMDNLYDWMVGHLPGGKKEKGDE